MKNGQRITATMAALAVGAASAIVGAASTSAAPGAAAVGSTQAPTLELGNADTDALLGASYKNALVNLLDINQVPYDEATYDATGFLSGGTFLRAGGGYDQPWTRDATVNSWNAGSLLAPDVARNTLWAVVKKPSDAGSLILQQDSQWWDQVVWITGAWNHYLVTGDEQFLADAYTTAVNTVTAREGAQYDASYGLFMGPSFFNDGIAGYPDALLDSPGQENHGSGSYSYPWVQTELALSTNTLYYEAYVNLANMARELGKPSGTVTGYQTKATGLKDKINEHFWQQDKGYYGYVIPTQGTAAGRLQDYQEGSGLSFAIMFGIADAEQTASIMATTHVSDWGVTDVWPRFDRYVTAGHAGRHNDVVWPMVQGYWASAAAKAGAQTTFATEVADLARLHAKTDSFYEIYDADTGAVDGGYQTGGVWPSQPDQTWSATAFLRMVYEGLFGIGYTTGGLTFTPTLPTGWGDATLSHVVYRGADLTIRLHGAGNRVSDFRVDGTASASHTLPATLTGTHTVDITLTGAVDADRDADGVADSADACPDRAGLVSLQGCPLDDDDQDGVIGAADLCPQTAGTTELQGCVDPELVEAEDSQLTLAKPASEGDHHAGASGDDFVGTVYSVGDSITFEAYHPGAAAGTTGTLRIRYANGQDAKTLSLYADGAKVRQVSFPKVSASWDDWAWLDVADVPMAGDVTTISLRYDAGDTGRANIDAFSYVSGRVVIPGVPLPALVAGSAYQARLGAVGGEQPYTFAMTGGVLPKGLSLDALTGELRGTPSSTDRTTFTVSVTDSKGRAGARGYTLGVPPVVVPPVAAATTTTVTASPSRPTLGARGTTTISVKASVRQRAGAAVTSGTVRFTAGGRHVDAAVRGGVASAVLAVGAAGRLPVRAQYLGTAAAATSAATTSVVVAKAGATVKVSKKKLRKALATAIRKGAKVVKVPVTVKVAGKKTFARVQVRVKGKGLTTKTFSVTRSKNVLKVRLTKTGRKRLKTFVVQVALLGTSKVRHETAKNSISNVR